MQYCPDCGTKLGEPVESQHTSYHNYDTYYCSECEKKWWDDNGSERRLIYPED